MNASNNSHKSIVTHQCYLLQSCHKHVYQCQLPLLNTSLSTYLMLLRNHPAGQVCAWKMREEQIIKYIYYIKKSFIIVMKTEPSIM